MPVIAVAEGYRFAGRWALGVWPGETEPFLQDLFARNPHITMRQVFDALWDRGYRPRRWVKTPNVTCVVGKNVLCQLLVAGSTTSAAGLVGIQYVAVGTGAGTPGKGDTQLFAELSRLAPSATSSDTSAGSCEIDAFWGLTQANAAITEVGCFGGGGATAAANTGTLFNHAAASAAKDSSETLTAACQFSF